MATKLTVRSAVGADYCDFIWEYFYKTLEPDEFDYDRVNIEGLIQESSNGFIIYFETVLKLKNKIVEAGKIDLIKSLYKSFLSSAIECSSEITVSINFRDSYVKFKINSELEYISLFEQNRWNMVLRNSDGLEISATQGHSFEIIGSVSIL